MDPTALLQTHAEIALALGGFAGVIGALTRPLSPASRGRFLVLLSISVRQVLGAVVPVWLFSFIGSPDLVWQSASLLGLALLIFHVVWLVFLPLRRLGPGVERTVLNRAGSTAMTTLSAASGVVFLTTAVGIPFGSSFAAYYLALLLGLASGFLLFADALVGPSAAR